MLQKEKSAITAPAEEPDSEGPTDAEKMVAAACKGLTMSDTLKIMEQPDGHVRVETTKFLGDAWAALNDKLKSQWTTEWVRTKPQHWLVKTLSAAPPLYKTPKRKQAMLSGEPSIMARILEIKPNLTVEAVNSVIETEIAKAAGLLTREAAIHLVAANLAVPLETAAKPAPITLEAVEAALTAADEDALQWVAVTENSSFVMAEGYHSELEDEQQKIVDNVMRGLGATYNAESGTPIWYVRKKRGGD